MEKFYKRLGLLALMLLSASFAFAQTTISGTVKDGITGEALPGVSILVKGKVIGTTTTVSGEFTLKVNQAPEDYAGAGTVFDEVVFEYFIFE